MKTDDYNYFYYHWAIITIFILLTIAPIEKSIAYFKNFLFVVRRQVAGVGLHGLVSLLHPLDMWSWVSCLTPLCLSVLSVK